MIMRMRLLQKIGLTGLTNWTLFKKKRLENMYKIVRNKCGIILMLHTLHIYYRHTTGPLLGV